MTIPTITTIVRPAVEGWWGGIEYHEENESVEVGLDGWCTYNEARRYAEDFARRRQLVLRARDVLRRACARPGGFQEYNEFTLQDLLADELRDVSFVACGDLAKDRLVREVLPKSHRIRQSSGDTGCFMRGR